jgi:hypothetical protein
MGFCTCSISGIKLHNSCEPVNAGKQNTARLKVSCFRGHKVQETYKLPSRNMTINDSFCTRLICSFRICLMGIHKIAASVVILGIALPIKAAFRLIHVPSIHGNHAFLMGLHWKMHTEVIAIHQPTTTAAMTAEICRKRRDGKIRRYIFSNASLTSITVARYMLSKVRRSLKKTIWSSVDTTFACLPSPWVITFVNSQL